jgi:UDP-N-acetylglucosamine:LPS N-acetylglucosamine transferase
VVSRDRSVALKRRLDELAAVWPRRLSSTLHVVGYTPEMDEYMAAADLLVVKPRV